MPGWSAMKGSSFGKAFALASIAVFSVLLLGFVWWGRFQYDFRLLRTVAIGLGVLIVVSNHWFFRDTRTRLGLRTDNLPQALRWYGIPTAGLLLLILCAGLLWGDPQIGSLEQYAIYLGWAFLQQYGLQNFLRLRLATVFRGSTRPDLLASLCAALFFALYHLPNLLLAILSLLGAFLWCLLYSRVPNLPAAAVSQALLTSALLVFFKYGPLQQFQIGAPGFRYDYYGSGVLVAGGKDAKGQPFVAALPGPDRGVPANLKIFTPSGELIRQWVAFEGLDFSGELAVGDLGFGPGDEIAVTPGPGGGNPASVRVFSLEGQLIREFAVPEVENGYGAWVSIGCGNLFVTPGPGPGAPPVVFRMNGEGQVLDRWEFPGLGLVNSIRATATCVEKTELRLLLWGTDIAVNPSTLTLFKPETEQLETIVALDMTFGLKVVPVNFRGMTVLATAPGPLKGYPPWIRAFDWLGKEVFSFAPAADLDSHGSNLGKVDTDGDGEDELILGEGIGRGRPTTIQVHRADGTLLSSWTAYEQIGSPGTGH